jgi:hypothetical protein
MSAGLGLESEPGSGKEKVPTGGTHLPAGGRGKRGRSRPRGKAGPGRSWAARWEREKRGTGQLGRAEGDKKKKKSQVGPGCKEKRREGKRKERVSRAQLEKREKKNCIQMHLNLNLKFKFKWKTNDKIMQWGMECTKTYISLYFLFKVK